MPFYLINVAQIIDEQKANPTFAALWDTNYTIIKGEPIMKHIIVLTPAEIETAISGCMAAISHYCREENEALPYQELIRKLEALQQTKSYYSKGDSKI